MPLVLEQSANHAVFYLQLNMHDAAKYVAKHAKVSYERAILAVNTAATFHKTSKVN